VTRVADEFHGLAEQAGYCLLKTKDVPWLSRYGHLNPEVRSGVPREVVQALTRIFRLLDGDEGALAAKTRGTVRPDFLWPARNLAVEVDEVQHFTRFRSRVLREYPPRVHLAFETQSYQQLCVSLQARAESAFAHAVAAEFPGAHSRARQRAYFDAVRDLCAPSFTAGPVLRFPAPERDAQLALARFSELAQPRQLVQPPASGPPRIMRNYANPLRRRPAPEQPGR